MKRIALCILDGWGCSIGGEHDAIYEAHTPCWNELLKRYPHCKLNTSGASVGLPNGQMGNSEVGHMTVGAGRITKQSLVRINECIENKKLKDNINLQNLIRQLKESDGRCHIMGLLSLGGVHSHQDHIIELMNIVNESDIEICLHIFLDGRDTAPGSYVESLNYLIKCIGIRGNISVATVSGRYYAMDRDNRWDRIKKSYDAIMRGIGEKNIDAFCNAGDSEEFFIPHVIGDYSGFYENDVVIMTNFRSDRMRQILESIANPHFVHFENSKICKNILCMTHYGGFLRGFPTIFGDIEIKNTLGEILSRNNLRQVRIAETEKYPHVTHFFNCGRDAEFSGETRVCEPSPHVATYDLQPEMSAKMVSKSIINAIKKRKNDVIIANFANADMVGHTGNFDATVKAVEEIDRCLEDVTKAALQEDVDLIITADHGNAEKMYDEVLQCKHTAHTIGRVPFVFVSNSEKEISLRDGCLYDIAPTMLKLLEISIPEEMTGSSLIE